MPVMADHDAARYFANIVKGDKHVRAGTGGLRLALSTAPRSVRDGRTTENRL